MALNSLMGIPVIPAVALFTLAAFGVYHYFIYPVFLSPLSKIPNAHWSAPVSRLWILSKRSVEQETPTVHVAHQRLGPIIRLAPNEVSVNSVEGGIRTIYAGLSTSGEIFVKVLR